jgi:hypothetical protein
MPRPFISPRACPECSTSLDAYDQSRRKLATLLNRQFPTESLDAAHETEMKALREEVESTQLLAECRRLVLAHHQSVH